MRRLVQHALCLVALIGLASPAAAQDAKPRHGIAMHGEVKYGPDFKHFDYANPDAPKGGEVRLSALQTFDNLNPFIIKGVEAIGLNLTFETLMTGSGDEPFSEYGLIAESLETPDDRSWVIFNLRPQAKFHDGSPITADDVLFSFDILRTKGAPNFRFYYAGVDRAEKLGDRRVKFHFKPGDNRELPLILGQLPVLSKKYWTGKNFEETTLTPFLGSGPYKVDSFEPGRFIVYRRVKDWWGKDLPANRGFYNFDLIRYDYYRDSTVALEAFKAGEYDWRAENEAKKWATGYDSPAVQDGRIKKETIDNDRPTGMQAFAYNIRRPLFQDARVRLALAYAFDFEWANKNLFYGQYARTQSYFSNSELASTGLPGPAELAYLEPLRAQVPPEVFTKTYVAPASDGSGNIRDNLRQALALLKDAGWGIKNGRLENAQGQPFQFEILIDQPVWERIALPFVQNLEKLGIKASIRPVDAAQYENRIRAFDFDMVVNSWGESNSPGNEQRDFWGSEAAKANGSRNIVGIQNTAVDKLVDAVIAAKSREQLVAATRALDRVLLWNHYVIPQWHLGKDRVAYWDKFGRPAKVPAAGVSLFNWWLDPAKAAGAAPAKQGWMPSLIGTAHAQGTQGGEAQPQPGGGDAGVITPPGDAKGAPNERVQELPAREAVPMPAAKESGWDNPAPLFAIAAIVVLIAWRLVGRRKR